MQAMIPGTTFNVFVKSPNGIKRGDYLKDDGCGYFCKSRKPTNFCATGKPSGGRMDKVFKVEVLYAPIN